MHAPFERRPRRAAQSGFTILETVIALFVALVIGFGAISLFLFSASYNAGASDRARALALAQERMETYRSKAFADIPAGVTEDEQVTLGEAEKADARVYNVDTTVEYDEAVPDNKQKIITVTVTPAATGGGFNAGGVMLKLVRASDTYGND